MKLIFAFILLFAFPDSGIAQFEKNRHHIGGDLSFSQNFFNGGSRTFSRLSGRYGYSLSDGFFLGGDITFSYTSRIPEPTTVGISPFVRYYFTLNDKGGMYGEAQAGISTAGVGNFYFMSPSIGYSIAVGKNIFIDVGLEYFRQLNRVSGSTISTVVGFKVALGGNEGF